MHTDRDRSFVRLDNGNIRKQTFLNNVYLMIIKKNWINHQLIYLMFGCFWFRSTNVITFKRFYYIITASASIPFKSLDIKSFFVVVAAYCRDWLIFKTAFLSNFQCKKYVAFPHYRLINKSGLFSRFFGLQLDLHHVHQGARKTNINSIS